MSSFTLLTYDDDGIVGTADDSARPADGRPQTIHIYDFLRDKKEAARALRDRTNVLAANGSGDFTAAHRDAHWAEGNFELLAHQAAPSLTREQQAALAA